MPNRWERTPFLSPILASMRQDTSIAIKNLIQEAGVQVTVFDQSIENPTESSVALCASIAKEANVDLIIGLGGGSSMDTAKGCNFILTNGGKMEDYWGVGKAELTHASINRYTNHRRHGKRVPIICINFSG